MNIPVVPPYTAEQLLEASRWWAGAVVAMLEGDPDNDWADQAADAGVPEGALVAMGRGQCAFLCKLVADARGEDPVEFARRFAYGAANITLDGPPQ